MPTLPLPRYTPSEYLSFERGVETRHEYCEGVIYALASGSLRHGTITGNCTRAFGNLLLERDCDVISSNLHVQVSPQGPYFYPDVVVVCGTPQFPDRETDTLINPLLIVEVESPSTKAYDHSTKLHHYRQIPSLQEYVLVSQTAPRLLTYCREHADHWQQTDFAGLEAHYHSGSLGLQIPLADIYRRVAFTE